MLQDGGAVFRKGGVRVDASSSHQDYFTCNVVAVRSELREALAVYKPQCVGEVTGSTDERTMTMSLLLKRDPARVQSTMPRTRRAPAPTMSRRRVARSSSSSSDRHAIPRGPKSAQRLGSEPSPTSFTTANDQRRVHKVVGDERVGGEPELRTGKEKTNAC